LRFLQADTVLLLDNVALQPIELKTHLV
jgi:hypothetical protein